MDTKKKSIDLSSIEVSFVAHPIFLLLFSYSSSIENKNRQTNCRLGHEFRLQQSMGIMNATDDDELLMKK
jgi:hypothetical protein